MDFSLLNTVRFSLLLIVTFLISSTSLAYASSKTEVNVSTNTGNNTVNGQTVESKSETRIIINGKEYVNDNTGKSYDIVEENNEGRIEVHVNSNKSDTKTQIKSNQGSTTTVTVTPKPTKTTEVKSSMTKKSDQKEEMKAEKKSILDSIKAQLDAFFSSITSFFSKK